MEVEVEVEEDEELEVERIHDDNEGGMSHANDKEVLEVERCAEVTFK